MPKLPNEKILGRWWYCKERSEYQGKSATRIRIGDLDSYIRQCQEVPRESLHATVRISPTRTGRNRLSDLERSQSVRYFRTSNYE